MTQNQIKNLVNSTRTMITGSKKMRNGRVKKFSNDINNNIVALTKILTVPEVASSLGISKSAVMIRICSSKKIIAATSKHKGIFMEITPSQDKEHSLKASASANSCLVSDNISKQQYQKMPIMEVTTKSGTKIVIFE